MRFDKIYIDVIENFLCRKKLFVVNKTENRHKLNHYVNSETYSDI